MALVNESITTPTDTNPIDGAHENKDMEPFEQKHVPQVVTDTQMQLDNENPSLSADIEPKNLPNKEEENIVDKQQLDVQTNKEAGELDTSTEAAAADEPINSASKDDAKLVDQKVADQNDDVIVKEENIGQQEDIVLLDQPQAQHKTTTPPPQNQQQNGDEGDGNGLASSLWIRNITNSTKAADLKTLFSKHGKVITAKIFTTKNKQSPTCFGYVTLSDPETADLCVQKLNRLNFKGRVINVEKADNSNLSQISKNANTTEPQQQQQKDSENTTDKPADVVEGRPARIKTPAESTGQPSSGAKRYVRTTHRENARDAALPSSKWRGTNSYSVRDRYGGTSSMRSRISSYAARQAASYAAHKAAPTSSYYPMRRIVQTSRGVRISTSAYPYNAAQIGREQRYEPPPESHHRTSSHLSSHPSALSSHHHRESRRVSPGQSDKEEMIRMMRRREEEHRKKEEELRLEREREKLKYEREKLEREKLELETMKLQAQLAHATHMQIAGFPVATAAALSGTSASTAPQHYIAQHSRAGAGPSSRRDQIANKERKAPIKRSGKEISTSSRHSDHRSNSRDVRRGGFSEGIDSRRSNRSRSRSPINRMASAGAERQQRSYHPEPAALPRQRGESRQQPKGEERHSDQGLRARPMAQQQPPPFLSSRYDKQFYGSEDAHSGRNYAAADQRPPGAANSHPQSRHKSPPKASQYFGTTGRYDSANLSDNAYNARTDTSYASRVGQPMASRPADQMFGNTGFGSTTGARGVAPMDPLMDYGYGREAQQPSGGSSFFQGGNWTAPSSSGRGVADMSSRAYPSNAGASSSSGSGLYNNAGTGEWGGMYPQRGGGQEQQPSNSSNRFPSSSYGKSAGTSYTQGGRRY